MTRLIIGLLISLPALAEDGGSKHKGVYLEDSGNKNTSISNIHVEIVGPETLPSTGFTPQVTTVGRETLPPALNPQNLTMLGEDKAKPPPGGNFGISVDGKDGLANAKVGSDDVVQQLTLPNGVVKTPPTKNGGQPVYESDLAQMAKGKKVNLDGVSAGPPSCPQGG